MKIKHFENNEIVEYEYKTFEELKALTEKWKEQFRETNKTDKILAAGCRDRYYERFCDDMDNLLSKFKCEKCAEGNHEGPFCRCEGRNIKLARELREKGLSPWQNRKQEREQSGQTD